MTFTKLVLASALATSLFAVPAFAQTEAVMAGQARVMQVQSPSASQFAKFVPQSQTKSTRMDYGVWDEALRHAVIYLGPSARRHMSRPEAQTGTRFVGGHRTAYRLEGSRVRFSELDAGFKSALSDYRRDLESLPDQVNLTHFSRNEQLAFWLNLHNVAVIEQIALNYPKQYPSDIKIGGEKLHDAKILTVNGTPLSLRDIREKIVYPNWPSPGVLYGFFRGDIGGPMIQNYAFKGSSLNGDLQFNAEEFVNSLRGVHEGSSARNVSQIYDEARRFYFPNFDADLTAHLLNYARPEVAEEIRSAKPISIDRYDRVVADLAGGERQRFARGRVTNLLGDEIDLPVSSYRYLREIETKVDTLKRRGLVGGGTVTIEDLPTVDVGVLPGTTATPTTTPEPRQDE